jgi:hypothetical protein
MAAERPRGVSTQSVGTSYLRMEGTKVPQKLIVTSPTALESLTHMLHDRWFDVDDLIYDLSHNSLAVPLERDSPKWRAAADNRCEDLRVGTLIIANVIRYVLRETEGIGRYDLNSVRYDVDEGRLELLTNIPVVFSVWVTSLHATVNMD